MTDHESSHVTTNADIVTRLREGHGQGCKCFAHCAYECGCDAIWAENFTNEAADEIERLRADRDRWRTVADVCVMAIGVPENDTDRIAVRHYDEAVRGE